MFEESPIHEFLQNLRSGPSGALLARADEFRRLATRIFVLTMIGFFAFMYFAANIFQVLKQPLLAALPPGSPGLHFTSPMEVFLAYMKVAFMASAMVMAPPSLYWLLKFVKSALPEAKTSGISGLSILSLGLFYTGIVFAYLAVLPATLYFLVSMGTEVAVPVITIAGYSSILFYMFIGFGLSFQMPVILIVLEKLDLITVGFLAKNRSYAVVLIVAIAAVITPTPDPFTQLALSAPMYLMYEGTILWIKAANRKNKSLAVPA